MCLKLVLRFKAYLEIDNTKSGAFLWVRNGRTVDRRLKIEEDSYILYQDKMHGSSGGLSAIRELLCVRYYGTPCICMQGGGGSAPSLWVVDGGSLQKGAGVTSSVVQVGMHGIMALGNCTDYVSENRSMKVVKNQIRYRTKSVILRLINPLKGSKLNHLSYNLTHIFCEQKYLIV